VNATSVNRRWCNAYTGHVAVSVASLNQRGQQSGGELIRLLCALLQFRRGDQVGCAAEAGKTCAHHRPRFLQCASGASAAAVAKQTVSLRQTTQSQVSQLTQNNLRSTLDLTFANVNLSQAQLLQLDSQKQRRRAMAAFHEVLGLDHPVNYSPPDSTDNNPPPPPDGTDSARSRRKAASGFAVARPLAPITGEVQSRPA
jgi:hypothetical protein